MMQAVTRHTLVVELHDRPGALYRAVGLIRRRDYNVSSLIVGATGDSETSRMVIVVEAADVHQVVQQFTRLVDVLSVVEIPYEEALLDHFAAVMRRFEHSPAAPHTEEPSR
ncbi:MAG: acetolactate synthase small subunit [Gemmatimonadaceae bacterium]|nr:acetolactate synthase small subunit [Gemmatimonadaceae bacterium]